MNESKKRFLILLQKLFISNYLLKYAERKFIASNTHKTTPVFIIGLPRSGTTLLYQLLIDNYRFAYFNNFSNFFYTCPVFASNISLKLFGYYKPEKYNSKYGVAPGLSSPSESGFIFRNWFNKELYNEDLIKQSISSISKIYNGPFITKNLYNNFRIEILNKIFPDAIFIEVKRDLKFIAQSLLLARKNTTGSYYGWFGLRPLDYQRILMIKDPFEQVSQQILSIEESIRDSMDKIESHRKITILYKELCENPENILNELMMFFNRNDIFPLKINDNHIPLKNSDIIKLNNADWKKLSKHLTNNI